MSKKTKKNKKIIPIIIIFATICVGTFFALRFFSKTNEPSERMAEKSTENSTDISTETVENSTKKIEETTEANTEQKPKIIQNEGEDPNQKEELTGSLTSAQISGDKLIIRVNIDQFLTTGNCVLNLTSGSKNASKEANIISVASTSTCEGFDVPINSLSSGLWNIEVKLSSNDKIGTIIGEVNI